MENLKINVWGFFFFIKSPFVYLKSWENVIANPMSEPNPELGESLHAEMLQSIL